MKTLFSIMTTNSSSTALRNPAFKKVWIPAEISCTCARRAASMKRALTFYECDALWPPPLRSNAAWQHL
jgi:hypothetical protein